MYRAHCSDGRPRERFQHMQRLNRRAIGEPLTIVDDELEVVGRPGSPTRFAGPDGTVLKRHTFQVVTAGRHIQRR